MNGSTYSLDDLVSALKSLQGDSSGGFSSFGTQGLQQAMGNSGSIPSMGTGAGSSGFGWNLGTANLGLSGIGTIGNLALGMKSLGLANKQFDFTKKTTETNLANQMKSYNTALEDRIRSRAAMQGNDEKYVQDYLAANRVTR